MGGAEQCRASFAPIYANAPRMNADASSINCFAVLLLFAMIMSSVCRAQEPPALDSAPIEAKLPRLKLSVTPALDAVQAALDAALLVGDVRVTIRVAHDAEGVVTHAEVQKSSGNDAVDNALSAWASQARIETEMAGNGLLNVRLDAAKVPSIRPSVIKASSTWPIEGALRDSHLMRLDINVLVTVDAKGKATEVQLLPKTHDAPLDAAISQWAVRNRYSTGTPGVVQLPLRLTMNLLESTRVMQVRMIAPPELHIIDKPSVGSIGRAFSNSFLDAASYEADIRYDVDGKVTDVRILGSSNSIVIKQIVLEWMSGMRIRPGNAGVSRIRVIVEPESSGPCDCLIIRAGKTSSNQ